MSTYSYPEYLFLRKPCIMFVRNELSVQVGDVNHRVYTRVYTHFFWPFS